MGHTSSTIQRVALDGQVPIDSVITQFVSAALYWDSHSVESVVGNASDRQSPCHQGVQSSREELDTGSVTEPFHVNYFMHDYTGLRPCWFKGIYLNF